MDEHQAIDADEFVEEQIIEQEVGNEPGNEQKECDEQKKGMRLYYLLLFIYLNYYYSLFNYSIYFLNKIFTD